MTGVEIGCYTGPKLPPTLWVVFKTVLGYKPTVLFDSVIRWRRIHKTCEKGVTLSRISKLRIKREICGVERDMKEADENKGSAGLKFRKGAMGTPIGEVHTE